jgi:outer membrane protein assembly factor BamB
MSEGLQPSAGTSNGRALLGRRAALVLPLALGGCSWFDWLTDDAKPPIHGHREPVLQPSRGLVVDAVADVTLPPVVSNPSWPQQGGDPAHSGGNLAGGLTKAWSRDIGAGGDYRTRITSQPLIVGGQVYTYDSDGVIAAWDLGGGQHVWTRPTKPPKNRGGNLGGGIAADGGRIYAATGRAEVMALNASDGTIIWRKPLGSPARSAPTVVGGSLFLCTINQQMLAFSAENGNPLWTFQATKADAGVLAVAAPAVSNGLVVAGFESGDLAAVSADNGTLAWSDNLGTLKGTASLLEFATVRGAPVIDGGLVFAIGLGGLMAALDLRSGRRVWERDVPSGNTPWLAGDTLFIIDTDQRVAAVSKVDGTVHWVTRLPQFENVKRTKGLISWTGPTLIAGKLIAASTNNHLAVLDPLDGRIVSDLDLSSSVSIAPVAAEGTLLILCDDAKLTAYK